MKRAHIVLTLLTGLVFTFTFADQQAPAPAPLAAGQQVMLAQRKNNGAYGDSAYSFRFASQDVAVHKNYVDLVYNGCGLLHINPVRGMTSRITDLGPGALAAAPDAPPQNAKWNTESIEPRAGDVYLQEINADGKQMLVKFRVDEVANDKVKLTWQAIKPWPDKHVDPRKGGAGTKGQCGGHHDPK